MEISSGNQLILNQENGQQLDFENAASHTLTLRVSDGWQNLYQALTDATDRQQRRDGSDLTDTATITINVQDVNDIGAISVETPGILYNTEGGEKVVLQSTNIGPTKAKWTGQMRRQL